MLLVALVVSVYVLMVKYSFTMQMLLIVIAAALLFIVLQVADYYANKKKQQVPTNGFLYYTNGVVTKKVIRIGAFAIASGVLLFSGNKVMLFGVVLLALLISELITLILELKNNNYFLTIDDKSITITYENKKIFPSHVKQIEFRHEMFYLTLKNDQVRTIELDRLKNEDKPTFQQQFINWANQHNLPFTDEAKVKLKIT